MNKTFHRQISVISVVYIALLAAMSFFFFWQRTGWNILFGMMLLAFTAIAIERLRHTTYTLTEDKKLCIDSGRGSKRKSVDIQKIIRVMPQRLFLGCGKYLLIECENGRLLTVQPENQMAFVEELKKRQDETT